MTNAQQLFDAYVQAWHAGEAPDAQAFLDRAPDAEREELAELIGVYAQLAPSVAPTSARAAELAQDPAVLRAMAIGDAGAAGSEPRPWRERLRVAREAAGLSLDELGERFAAAFGLGDRAPRASALLGRLEAGELDATGVSVRAATRLAELLGQASDALSPPRAVPLYRAEADADLGFDEEFLSAAAAALARDDGESWDELDELLRGG